MNFFRAQEQARKQTFWLVTGFSLAVILLVLLTLLLVIVFVWHSDVGLLAGQAGPAPKQGGAWEQTLWVIQGLGWSRILAIVVLVAGTIGMGVVFRWWHLRDGGSVVAESLGGIPLEPGDDFKSQRLRNLVEEMSLAAGMPVPPVYVLPHEAGINAFAAGLSQEDAVIAVSQGALDQLNREQLQGVVAHEISHILNGDMRLNVQMVAVLHGITMISEAGRVLMDVGGRRRYRSHSNKGGGFVALFVLGLALFVLGWTGQLMGHLIRAAVSRQREYLADASAVQFTRNPHGIGGALRVIAGHGPHGRIRHRRADEYSHLFFANAVRFDWFASHPPLGQRITRLLPDWDGAALDAQPLSEQEMRQQSQGLHSEPAQVAGLAPLEFERVVVPDSTHTPAAAVTTLNTFTASTLSLTPEATNCVSRFELKLSAALQEQVHSPLGAVSVVLALLLDDEKRVRDEQLTLLLTHAKTWLVAVEQARKMCGELPSMARLPLLELAMPALKKLSRKQYQRLRQLMGLLIQADLKVSPGEWVIYEWVRQHGDRFFGLNRPVKPRYRHVHQIQGAFNIVLCRLLACEQDQENARLLRHQQACIVGGFEEMPPLQDAACRQATFTRAVHTLSEAFPLLKPRMLKALIFAARSDGEVSAEEHQLISTIALIWDCPLIGLDDAFV